MVIVLIFRIDGLQIPDFPNKGGALPCAASTTLDAE
jgi:hypothetical protein